MSDILFQCEIPPSPHPWRVVKYNGKVIFLNPDHQPLWLNLTTGKLEPIDWKPPQPAKSPWSLKS